MIEPSTIIAAGIVVAGLGVAAYKYKDKIIETLGFQSKPSQTKGQVEKNATINIDAEFQWLETLLATYKKDYISYTLEMFRLKNHLTNDQVSDLQTKYGKVLATPSFKLHQEYIAKFSNWSNLKLAEKQWLQQRNVAVDDEEHFPEKIRDLLTAEASEEASKIFADFCEQNSIEVVTVKM